MKRFFEEGLTKEQIEERLEAIAEEVEETTYPVYLDENKRGFLKDKLTELSVSEARAQEEFDLVKEEFKDRLKPIREEKAEVLSQIRTGREEVRGKVYHCADHDEGKMYTISAHGDTINVRPLLPEEKQLRIKTAVNDGK